MTSLEIKNGMCWFDAGYKIDKIMFADNKIITSEQKIIEGLPNFKWHIKIEPLVTRSTNHGNIDRFLNINLVVDGGGDDDKVDYSIYSRINSSQTYKSIYENFTSSIYKQTEIRLKQIDICDLQDAGKGYFSRDGKMDIHIHATFMPKRKINYLFNCAVASNWGSRLIEDDKKDFEFIVSGKSIKVHKLLISVESTVLADLFKNSSGDNLDIPEFKFETVKAAIDFCYAQNISEFLENDQNSLDLLIFADKYDFQTLKPKLEEHLTKNLTKENIGEMFKIADKTNSKILWQACIDYVKSLLNSNISGSEIDVSSFDANFMAAILQQALKLKK